jgi:tetratricopeptide (TPR) repeat protein
MKTSLLGTISLVVLLIPRLNFAEEVNLEVIHRIKQEAFYHSQVMDLVDIHFALGIALMFNGELNAALQEFNRQESGSFGLMGRTMVLYELGRLDEHEASLQEFIDLRGGTRPSEVAQIYAFTGNNDAAFDWLNKAIAINEPRFGTELSLPVYDPIRKDMRWINILQRMGVSPVQLNAIEFEVTPPH